MHEIELVVWGIDGNRDAVVTRLREIADIIEITDKDIYESDFQVEVNM